MESEEEDKELKRATIAISVLATINAIVMLWAVLEILGIANLK